MYISFKLSRKSLYALTAVLSAAIVLGNTISEIRDKSKAASAPKTETRSESPPKKNYIKWVDFSVTEPALKKAMKLDIESHNTETPLDWIELLSVLAVKYGGDFKSYREQDLLRLAERIKSGEKIEDITRNMKYYSYYHSAYTAVLGEYVGEYKIQKITENGESVIEPRYGLKAFSPIAAGYGYSHYNDFGASRSYGFKRKHLGHDIMGNVGTPIIAVESGYIEALGWNQYGGWRIGIRSFDKKRYYYYAHLRKNHPFPKHLAVGNIVKAGDVIGYLGMTGYSSKENVNNIDTPHLHFGIQLIFDESQKDGNGEIWIDCYEISKFLSANKSAAVKSEISGEYERRLDFFEASVENIE